MGPESRNTSQDMPLAARFIAGVIGVVLIAGCVALLVAVRPLNWKSVGLAIGAAGLGGDLLHGCIRRTWPVAALLWLVP
jgi:hypothetical protein